MLNLAPTSCFGRLRITKSTVTFVYVMWTIMVLIWVYDIIINILTYFQKTIKELSSLSKAPLALTKKRRSSRPGIHFEIRQQERSPKLAFSLFLRLLVFWYRTILLGFFFKKKIWYLTRVMTMTAQQIIKQWRPHLFLVSIFFESLQINLWCRILQNFWTYHVIWPQDWKWCIS